MSSIRKRILVVDDTGSFQVLLERWIKGAGFDVDIASSGTEALAHAAASPPDLILLDVMMPEMNGYVVCRKLREMEQTRKTPIIVITSLQASADEQEARMSGANDMVVKPFNQETIVKKVRQYLGPLPV